MKLKFNEDNTIEELQHASPAKPGKHFQSFFVDCFLLILVSYFLFMLGNNIAVSTKAFKEAQVIVQEEVEYYKDYVEESRAVEFEIINGEKVRKDAIVDQNTGVSKIILENLNRAIYYSYQKYGDFDNQFGIKISEENMELIKLSVSDKGHAYDDNVSYFYNEFIYNSQDNYGVKFYSEKEAHEYVQNVYKDAFGSQNSNKFFVFDLEQSVVPILKTEAAYYLYYFVYVAEDADITDEAEDYYYLFDTSYSSMLSKAEKLMIQAEPYYSTHYQVYYENNAVLGRCVNIALIIAVVLGYIITIIIPKIIMKHGRTIGRFLFKLGEIDIHNEPITWKVVLVKGILGCIGYLPVIFLIYMLEPFNGSFSAMYMPFIGEVQLMVILIIILVLVLINGTVMLFTRNKVGIDGIITKSILVDRHYLDELLFEEE
jgi:hypothetical protein